MTPRQLQSVTVVQHADRHGERVGREFAVAWEVVVPAGELPAVLRSVADQAPLPRGRFTLTISDPFDPA
jgi:hypothetical protein